MDTWKYEDVLHRKLHMQDESVTSSETNDILNNNEELSYFQQSQGYGTSCQSSFNMSVQRDNQTENFIDGLNLSDFAELTLTEQFTSDEDSSCGGCLLVWGCGEFGQHGHGHTEDVRRDNAVVSPIWLGQDRAVLKVSCGSSHTLVVTDDNKVYSWGNSNSGQLGTGGTETCAHPLPVHLGVSSGTKLKGLTCGTRHSFIWTQDGDCFSFGNNYSGQLGYDFRKPDFKENQLRPVFVDTLLRRPVSQVACGSRHSVFLFTNGQVAAVGVNNRGQIGCGDTADVVCAKTLSEIPPMSLIACGNSHTLATDVNGHAYAWGYGKACGSKTDILSPSWVYSCSERDKIVDMAGGDSHSMILLSSGTIYSWGNNFEGQLGQGKSVKFVSDPRELSSSLLPGIVTSVSIGETTCAAVTDAGKLYMWGKNSNQVIRDDENGRFFQFEPHLVSLGVWKALKVSCGSWHVACVVSASREREINEIHQDSETATVTTKNNLKADHVSSIDETVGKQFMKEEQLVTVFGNDPPCKEGFPINSNKEKEKPFANNLILSDGSEAKVESLDPFNVSEGYYLETQNIEHVDNTTCEGFKIDADSDVETKAEIIGDITWSESSAEINNPAINFSFEEKPVLEERTDSVTNEGISEEKPCIINNMRTAEDDKGKVPFIVKFPSESSGHDSGERGLSIEQKRKNVLDVKLNQSANEQEVGIGKEESEAKVVPEQRQNPGPFTRTNEFSEEACGRGTSSDIVFALRSGSLDNIRVSHQQESTFGVSRRGRVAYSPPANPRSSVGHLAREKRTPRMLRRSSFDVEYQLPNQPIHTVDIAMTPSVLRQVYPPMNRTQSSPSLYSSNLVKSPLGHRKNTKVPRPPACTVSTDNQSDNLPPKPPARGVRRFREINPMFSSGASWRKR